MSRRDEKRQAYTSMLIPEKTDGSSAKSVGHKICGTCKNYMETSWSNDGRGSCNVLKMGSNIGSNPPVHKLDGKEGYMSKTLSDASACQYYEKMKMLDKDGYECSDPIYRRSMRQVQQED
ncbi:MAG: hypothetical protein PF482_16750 [Desulfobacteraceae bacterium]|nr:hypothetical protein [Desulfobacteraceae bacterium]